MYSPPTYLLPTYCLPTAYLLPIVLSTYYEQPGLGYTVTVFSDVEFELGGGGGGSRDNCGYELCCFCGKRAALSNPSPIALALTLALAFA
jgi:hypothetical protein